MLRAILVIAVLVAIALTVHQPGSSGLAPNQAQIYNSACLVYSNATNCNLVR